MTPEPPDRSGRTALARRPTPVSQLHEITDSDASALVDLLLGRANEQSSGLLKYRFGADFQRDWKAELGHWLHTAESFGFIEPLWARAVGRLTGGGDAQIDVDPNDRMQRMLLQDLAPAMFVHYLAGLGWRFEAWEPPRPPEADGGHLDVDVSLVAPDRSPVDVQVKAPDQPGVVRNRRRVHGESDEAVIRSLSKAAVQLPRAGAQAKMIAVSALRDWPLTWEPGAVVAALVGRCLQLDDEKWEISSDRLGAFATVEWAHVGAVLLLDLVRSEAVAHYGSIVLVNPWAPVRIDPAWFPASRVCTIEAGIVRWAGGAPRYAGLPEGTVVLR